MLTHDKPIVVIAEEGGEEEAVMRLGRIGFDNVSGFLADGMRALEHRGDLVERTERITAPALAEWLAGDRPDAGATPVILDIRSEAEHAGGHVAGSLNIPLPKLEERIGEVPHGPVVVHCEGGYRSAIGASLLQRLGRAGVHDLVGGFKAWLATKAPAATGS
jgi:hydroxyacylglutathione hydrolase